MQAVDLGNTRISTAYAQKSPRIVNGPQLLGPNTTNQLTLSILN